METFLRAWRKDALDKGQHESAVFIGDKVLALTSEYLWLGYVCELIISRQILISILQIVTMTPSGSPKSTSPTTIILERWRYYREGT